MVNEIGEGEEKLNNTMYLALHNYNNISVIIGETFLINVTNYFFPLLGER